MSADASRHSLKALTLAIGLTLASAAAAQDLQLTGPAGQTATLAPAEIAALPHVTLTVQVEGKSHTYQGVPLTLLLAKVGAPSGPAIRGKALGDIVVASAKDGYVVALALAEVDPMFRKDQIILADGADGQPLPQGVGPYRLVVEGDLRAARSARMVTALEVRQVAVGEGR
jgi:DMSO/TMAO reductase YedYZ molybdopterin-dependent catalytic subunit